MIFVQDETVLNIFFPVQALRQKFLGLKESLKREKEEEERYVLGFLRDCS